MKTLKLTFSGILLMLFLLPFSLSAQWNIVRFDQKNTFINVNTVSENHAFAVGIDPEDNSQFVLKTMDGGITWDSLNISGSDEELAITAIHFIDESTGFLGGINYDFQTLYKTIDNGKNWQDVTPEQVIYREISSISFTDPQNGFVSNGMNIYSTKDGGKTWKNIIVDFTVNNIHFTDLKTGFAAGTGGDFSSKAVLMKTSDGGATWRELLSVRDERLFVTTFPKIDFINPETFITSIQNTNILYRTTNGGASWDSITIDSSHYITDYDFTSALQGHVINDKGEILFTQDGGKTWKIEYSAGWGFYGPEVFLTAISIKNGIGYVTGSNGVIKKYKSAKLSVPEINLTQLNIYPNPVSRNGILNFYVNENKNNSNILLLNSLGQTVYAEKIIQGINVINLESLNLPSGIYFVNLIHDETRAVQKLIITK